jgi:signal peptidase I
MTEPTEEKENSQNTSCYKVVDIITNALCAILLVVMVAGVLHYGRRIFVAERFNIPTSSMSPTLVPGDRIWVNKLLFGGRIYKSFNFENHAPLRCFRMPGFRKINPGDVICFNFPLGYDEWTVIEFKINYVYCKRVVGVPGDTIGIRDGITWNNNYPGTIGVIENQLAIKNTPDSVLWGSTYMRTMPFTIPMWTIKNFGPLYVPQKGVTVELDSVGRAIYGPVIEYEMGSWPTDNMVSHTFQNNYYFALGDNSLSSQDSRYWGFIPEDFIIGIVGGRRVKNRQNQ